MHLSPGHAAGLLLGFLLSAGAVADAAASSLDDSIAALEYRIGKEAAEIAEFQIKEQIYLDSRHLIVPGGASQHYLVTLQDSCHGLRSNRIIPWTHTRHHLARGDFLAPTHQGRRVDECKVERIQELEPK